MIFRINRSIKYIEIESVLDIIKNDYFFQNVEYIQMIGDSPFNYTLLHGEYHNQYMHQTIYKMHLNPNIQIIQY